MSYERISLGPYQLLIGLSSETKPDISSVPLGSRAYEADTDETYIATPSGWKVYGLTVLKTEHPRLSVTPEVGGTPQAKQQFGDGTVELRYLRGTINAGDDVVAGARLLNGYPDTFMMLADNVYQFQSDVAITRLDMVAIGDALSGSATAGHPVDEAGTEAETIARMVTHTFDSADDVRLVIITLSQHYSAAAAVATATNFVMAQTEGRSYAA